ncbi:MAG: DUF4982 domain-containing protein, partial [Kiritimatiellae bacterium]|nr:DUF4982 domain-containing protein [Kiritimatiellia bacterium]
GGVTSLNGEWAFKKDGDAAFRNVTVPHDWAIAGPFDPEGEQNTGKLPYRGKGVYKRGFDLPAGDAELLADGGRAYLEFDGVMSSPRVKLNGREVGAWDYGYMGFTLDVTPFVRRKDNRLEVSADTTQGYSRFYCGGGLYRDVRLVVRPKEHVLPGTLAIATPKISRTEATVRVSCTLAQGGATNWSFVVRKPRIWDVDHPYLYVLELFGEKFRYGIREFKFTADDGFHLNGRRVQLKGACLHSDLGLLGMAWNRAAAKRELNVMKDMGVNAIRTSHNVVAPEFLDLCDEMGFVVWNECFDKWDGSALRDAGTDGLDEFATRNLKAFVRRDRNHPCVVVWSIGNEIPPATEKFPTGVKRDRCARYRAAVLEEDETRPVGIGAWEKETCESFLDLDVTGWNYARRYMPMRELAPDKPIVYTESGSSYSDGGFYMNPPAGGRNDLAAKFRATDGYDHTAATYSDISDVEFHRMEKDRFVAGEFTWTGVDYLGEPSPYTWWGKKGPVQIGGVTIPPARLARSSYYGAVDLTHTPKDRFWLFRSHWNDRAHTVHLLPHWNWKAGDVVPVYFYTDGDEAELFLNGRSQGRRKKLADVDYPLDHDSADNAAFGDFRTNRYYRICDKYRLRWNDVKWEAGELKAVAYKDGRKIGEDVVRTAGPAMRVKLEKDAYAEPNGDLAFAQVSAVDAQGVRDPWSDKRVFFTVRGPGEIVAVGNGDPCDLDSFAETSSHKLRYGRALAIVRRKPGTRSAIVLEARAEGLGGAMLSLDL